MDETVGLQKANLLLGDEFGNLGNACTVEVWVLWSCLIVDFGLVGDGVRSTEDFCCKRLLNVWVLAIISELRRWSFLLANPLLEWRAIFLL